VFESPRSHSLRSCDRRARFALGEPLRASGDVPTRFASSRVPPLARPRQRSSLPIPSLAALDWKQYVETDPRYLRPTEVDHLHGDASRARAKLDWKPTVTFRELITMMVRADEEDVRTALAGRAPAM
jgi:GDP-D-mannose dehydratase